MAAANTLTLDAMKIGDRYTIREAEPEGTPRIFEGTFKNKVTVPFPQAFFTSVVDKTTLPHKPEDPSTLGSFRAEDWKFLPVPVGASSSRRNRRRTRRHR